MLCKKMYLGKYMNDSKDNEEVEETALGMEQSF